MRPAHAGDFRDISLKIWSPPQNLWVRNDDHPEWEELSDTGMVRDSYPTWAGRFLLGIIWLTKNVQVGRLWASERWVGWFSSSRRDIGR